MPPSSTIRQASALSWYRSTPSTTGPIIPATPMPDSIHAIRPSDGRGSCRSARPMA